MAAGGPVAQIQLCLSRGDGGCVDGEMGCSRNLGAAAGTAGVASFRGSKQNVAETPGPCLKLQGVQALGYSVTRSPEAAAESSGAGRGIAPLGSSPAMAGPWIRLRREGASPWWGTGWSWVPAQHALALGSQTAEKQRSRPVSSSHSAKGKGKKKRAKAKW